MEDEFKEKFEVVFENLLSKVISKFKKNTDQTTSQLKKTIEFEMDRHLYFCDFMPNKSDTKLYEEVTDTEFLKTVMNVYFSCVSFKRVNFITP
jgi:hypothetical protein